MSRNGQGVVYLLGHSHLDTAWLWPISDTRETLMRTVENVLNLMRKYQGFTYAQSTALYYEWLKTFRPDLLEEVRRRIGEGRWEVVGGSWVECDCIIPSGEGLVRQFLYGKRLVRELLNVDVRVAWFPDSFGFPSSLPQILQGCGIDYFVTQKLNWNDMVMFPYNIFIWSSPDGSEVTAYQTVGGYSDDPSDLLKIISYYMTLQERQGIHDLLVVYGYGDHGLGPREEQVRSAESLVREVPEGLRRVGIGVVRHGRAEDYLRGIRKALGDSLPRYEGELYLQFHRGTYTSQVRVKELVKEIEYLLEVYEKLLTIKYLVSGNRYEVEDVEAFWREVLTAHFHDVLSGSLSKTPYNQFLKSLSKLRNDLRTKVNRLISNLLGPGEGFPEGGEHFAAFNPLPWEVRTYFKVPGSGWVRFRVPPLTLTLVRPERAEGIAEAIDDGDRIILRNGIIEVGISKSTGGVKSLRFKDGKEFLGDRGISIEVYDDTPILGRATAGTLEKIVDYVFDSWELYYLENLGGVRFRRLAEPVRVEIIESGPLVASAVVEYDYRDDSGTTKLKHELRLYADEPFVEGSMEIDWALKHRLLKLVIDLSYQSDNIVVGQPYGHWVRRNPASPYSTLHDRAKWEAWFNEWLDCSDGDIGLALICGNRFGYDLMGNTLRLTLLRAPRFPPENALHIPWTSDLLKAQEFSEGGKYRVTYYLYPHRGNWEFGKVPKRAQELLRKPYTTLIRGGRYMYISPLLVMDSNSITEITALKLCEDSYDCVIMRVFNPYSTENTLKVALHNEAKFELFRVNESNLLEEDLNDRSIHVHNEGFSIRLKPLKIRTLKLILKRKAKNQ